MSRQRGKYLAETSGRSFRRRRPKHRALILITVLLLLAAAGTGLGFALKKDELHGQWLYGSTVYSFDGRGKGSMELPEEVYPYIYQAKGNRLTLDFEDERLSDPSYRYAIAGERLTLEGDEALGGASYELVRVKK